MTALKSFLSLAGVASAFNFSTNATAVTTTEIVTAYTTFCPSATIFTEGNNTYTVTEASTVTVTDCPCTRTYTYHTSYVTVCPSSTTGVAEAPSSINTSVAANNAQKQIVSGGAVALMLLALL